MILPLLAECNDDSNIIAETFFFHIGWFWNDTCYMPDWNQSLGYSSLHRFKFIHYYNLWFQNKRNRSTICFPLQNHFKITWYVMIFLMSVKLEILFPKVVEITLMICFRMLIFVHKKAWVDQSIRTMTLHKHCQIDFTVFTKSHSHWAYYLFP